MLLLCTSSNSSSWFIPETANSVKLRQFHQGFFFSITCAEQGCRWGPAGTCTRGSAALPTSRGMFRAGTSHRRRARKMPMENTVGQEPSCSAGSSRQGSISCGWWIPVASERSFPRLKEQPRLWGRSQTRRNPRPGINVVCITPSRQLELGGKRTEKGVILW